MARCKLTRMNLRNIRKSREYQALLIDLVATNVVGKSAAEELLGYTIPAGLLGGTVTDDDTEPSGESGGEVPPADPGSESGGEVPPTVDNTVTLLYYATPKGGPQWLTAEYDLTDDPNGTGILAFARTEFGNNDTIDSLLFVEEDPEYVEGESDLIDKYISLDPQPDTLEPGMLIMVCNDNAGSPK